MTEKIIIKSKYDLKEWLSYEHKNYGNVSGWRLLFGYGEQAILWKHQVLLRKAEYHYNTNNKLLYFIYSMRLNQFQAKYALHIPINCCGRGLKLMHVGPVLVNEKALLGNDCVLHMNVGIVGGDK